MVPAVENALLCGHDLIFLGERGQAKTRMIRQLTALLDEWLPIVAGSEIHDDPFAPVSAYARHLVAEQGDETPVAWVHRDERYVEKLATPDVSIADLIGDVDPVKVAAGRSLGDELTIHFGLLPRTNRGIFCINELPDLTEKVQVGLFNVMQERDVQVKGYRVRLPLDVLVVASANPEDYTSRGRIITPLKDRYAAQVRTHYPPTRELELAVVLQEAKLPQVDGVTLHVPPFMQDLVAELTLQARASDRREPELGRLGADVDRELRDARRERRCAARCDSARPKPCRASPISPRSKSRRPASSSSSTPARRARRRKSSPSCVKRATKMRLRRARAVRGHRQRRRRLRAGLEGRGLGRDAVGRSTRKVSTRSPACATRRRASRAAIRRARLASAIEFVLEGLHLDESPQQERRRRRSRSLRAA